MGNVPAPPQGLFSNSNYFIASPVPGTNNTQLNPITNLVVTIVINQPIEAATGFDFQLNAFPVPGDGSFQQYVLNLDTSRGAPFIGYSVQYLPGPFNTGPLVLLPLPPNSGPTLPAGYVLTITLTSDPNTNETTMATFEAEGPAPMGLPPEFRPRNSLSVTIPGGLLTEMVAFQLTVDGRDGGVCTYLASGAGTFTYQASTSSTPPSPLPLTVLPTPPPAAGVGTGEQSNCEYAPIDEGPNQGTFGVPIQQGFWANVTTRIYRPGANFAVSQQAVPQQVGPDNQTNLYAVNQAGELEVFSVGSGGWGKTATLGTVDMAHPEANPAASQLFGSGALTYAFVVDQTGQIQAFWTEPEAGSGPAPFGPYSGWNGPAPFGPPGNCSKQAYLAVSNRFGVWNQTDVFWVDLNGSLNVLSGMWDVSVTAWGSAQSIGGNYPSNAPIAVSQQFGVSPPTTNVFLFDNNGDLNVLSVVGQGEWSVQKVPANVAFSPGAFVTASQRFGVSNQTDVYAVDNNGYLHVFSLLSSQGSWANATDTVVIGPPVSLQGGGPVAVSQQFDAPDQTDVFVVDQSGQIWMAFSVQGGGWSAPTKIGPPGLAPMPDQSVTGHGAFILASPQYGVTGQTDLFVIAQNGPTSSYPGWPTVLSLAEGGTAWTAPTAL